jgi:hypothetical protein
MRELACDTCFQSPGVCASGIVNAFLMAIGGGVYELEDVGGAGIRLGHGALVTIGTAFSFRGKLWQYLTLDRRT